MNLRRFFARTLVLGLFTSVAFAAGPHFRYVIHLTLNGRPVSGALQTSDAADPGHEDAILKRNIFPLARNTTTQLVVTVVGPDGIADYTSSDRLVYDGGGCLTVTSAGALTATPSGPCVLMIFLLDPTGEGLTYNYFLFSVS